MTPRETSPTWCPARPTRCSPLATDGGASTWTTRSTAPMSMPSSRLEVATTAGSRPALSASSISARSSLDTEPWWARASSAGAPAAAPACAIISAGRPSPASAQLRLLGGLARSAASSLSRPHSRSASRRELANTIVDRCASIRSSTRSSTCGQIDRRGARARLVVAGAVARGLVLQLGHVLDRDDDLSSMRLAAGRLHHGHRPARRRGSVATSSTGRTVADSPIRWAGRSSSASSRSRRQRQVGAALGAGDRVDLVDDHGLDPAQRSRGPAR